MLKDKGFTLIEAMICVVMLVVFVSVIPPFVLGDGYEAPTPRTECRLGYIFQEDSYMSGDFEQVIGQNGGGIPCGEVEKSLEVLVEDSENNW